MGAKANWQRTRAKEQLGVAQVAFDKADYSLALKAAKRVVKIWPLSDYAPQAQFLVARCYEADGNDERAFKAYQNILEKYPKSANFEKVLRQQYLIANRFFQGEWFRLWGYIPLYPSMDKTAGLYGQIVTNGPYSSVAPLAQLRVGASQAKQHNYADAVKAFELAADRYHDQPVIAADALYKAGLAYSKQAETAEYDQNTAQQAISTFTDFMALYPDDPRVPKAKRIIAALKTEQSRGNFEIAEFYEKDKKWNGALIYYNEVLIRNPNSPYATPARERIEKLKKRIEAQTASR